MSVIFDKNRISEFCDTVTTWSAVSLRQN